IGGVADRNEAQTFSGRSIGVADSTLPAVGDDEFYWKDLIGLTVEDGRGVVLGEVTGLIETGANDVLVVRATHGEELIPFVDQFVKQVDLTNRRLIVDWVIGG